ncbi:hypothetical protein GDO81_028179 [Engystomops pustulosus]|uniref:Uncharacterized protein n=1 Tax=Engystomops pustulosus TaxID=76066 RepID=A0AAV6YEG8_ENGPU|nr:hypothetical protein GDO81_028179 [Engystomops pustulosus]
MGNFNMVMEEKGDRFKLTKDIISSTEQRSKLSYLCEDLGWLDVWRRLYGSRRAFSCMSRSYNTLSRIDLCLTNPAFLSSIRKMVYEKIIISDHAPVMIILKS